MKAIRCLDLAALFFYMGAFGQLYESTSIKPASNTRQAVGRAMYMCSVVEFVSSFGGLKPLI